MKWLDLYPDALSSVASSRPVESSSNFCLVTDGPFAEVPDLPAELNSVPLYAWLLPAKRVPKEYNDLFLKYGIPLLE